MPSLTMCLPFAVFQEEEIVWGKANQSPRTLKHTLHSLETHMEAMQCKENSND